MTDDGRTFPDTLGDEQQVALDYLEFHRETLAWKTSGLTQEQLAKRLSPSTMTLGGLLKHLALVEDSWFTRVFAGEPMPSPWAGVDWKSQPDWEWDTAASDSPEELMSLWQASVSRSRAVVEGRSFDELAVRERWGKQLNLRWIVLHMVEEYARHNGHADLIRESIDGLTGE